MKLEDVKRGTKYMDRKLGEVLYIANHPNDGAYLIVEAYDAEEDEFSLHGTEAMYLEPIPDAPPA